MYIAEVGVMYVNTTDGPATALLGRTYAKIIVLSLRGPRALHNRPLPVYSGRFDGRTDGQKSPNNCGTLALPTLCNED